MSCWMISLIAAVDMQGGIGKNNKLLCHLPADLQYFKAMTSGKTIIMGRKTLESIGRALPDRQNIVLSRNELSIPGVIGCHSLEQALKTAQSAKEIMIIGGESVFDAALPLAGRVYLTVIKHIFAADVFFPALDLDLWECISQVERPADDKNAYALTFSVYARKNFQKVVDKDA